MPDIFTYSLLINSSSPHLCFLDLLTDHSFFDPPPISAPFFHRFFDHISSGSAFTMLAAEALLLIAPFSFATVVTSQTALLSALSALLLALLLLSPVSTTTWTHPKHSAMPCCQLAAETLARSFPDPHSVANMTSCSQPCPQTSEKYDQDSDSSLQEPPTN